MSNAKDILAMVEKLDLRAELQSIKDSFPEGFGEPVLADDASKRAELLLLLTPQRAAAKASSDVFDFLWNRPDQTAAEFLADHGVTFKSSPETDQ